MVEGKKIAGFMGNDGIFHPIEGGGSSVPDAQEDNFASFDEEGGLKDSGFNSESFAPKSHTHTEQQIPGLTNKLKGKLQHQDIEFPFVIEKRALWYYWAETDGDAYASELGSIAPNQNEEYPCLLRLKGREENREELIAAFVRWSKSTSTVGGHQVNTYTYQIRFGKTVLQGTIVDNQGEYSMPSSLTVISDDIPVELSFQYGQESYNPGNAHGEFTKFWLDAEEGKPYKVMVTIDNHSSYTILADVVAVRNGNHPRLLFYFGDRYLVLDTQEDIQDVDTGHTYPEEVTWSVTEHLYSSVFS